MKIRSDFVTNSSSSSFILLREVPEEIKKEDHKKFDSFNSFLHWYMDYYRENYYTKELEEFCKAFDLSEEQKFLVKLGFIGCEDRDLSKIILKVYSYLSAKGNSVSIFESIDNNYPLHEFLCKLPSETIVRISE